MWSICCRRWSTGRWSSPNPAPTARPATGCWKPCANTASRPSLTDPNGDGDDAGPAPGPLPRLGPSTGTPSSRAARGTRGQPGVRGELGQPAGRVRLGAGHRPRARRGRPPARHVLVRRSHRPVGTPRMGGRRRSPRAPTPGRIASAAVACWGVPRRRLRRRGRSARPLDPTAPDLVARDVEQIWHGPHRHRVHDQRSRRSSNERPTGCANGSRAAATRSPKHGSSPTSSTAPCSAPDPALVARLHRLAQASRQSERPSDRWLHVAWLPLREPQAGRRARPAATSSTAFNTPSAAAKRRETSSSKRPAWPSW